jgi:hypothetical protein
MSSQGQSETAAIGDLRLATGNGEKNQSLIANRQSLKEG